MPSLENYGFWLDHDGKIVQIERVTYCIRARSHEHVYPVKGISVEVFAEAVDKTSVYYGNRKAELGDDWSIDILASDIELQSDVQRQCEAQGVPIDLVVKFEGGLADGRTAKLRWTKPVEIGMLIPVGDQKYVLRDGPIARAVVETKKCHPEWCLVATLQVLA